MHTEQCGGAAMMCSKYFLPYHLFILVVPFLMAFIVVDRGLSSVLEIYFFAVMGFLGVCVSFVNVSPISELSDSLRLRIGLLVKEFCFIDSIAIGDCNLFIFLFL